MAAAQVAGPIGDAVVLEEGSRGGSPKLERSALRLRGARTRPAGGGAHVSTQLNVRANVKRNVAGSSWNSRKPVHCFDTTPQSTSAAVGRGAFSEKDINRENYGQAAAQGERGRLRARTRRGKSEVVTSYRQRYLAVHCLQKSHWKPPGLYFVRQEVCAYRQGSQPSCVLVPQ